MSRKNNKRTIQRQLSNQNTPRIIVQPKSLNQHRYLMSMITNDLTFCLGPAGSGKSSVAVGLACNWLQEKKVERIIITRPTVESGGSIGFIPGDKDEKLLPYVTPVLEEMYKYMGRETTNKMKDAGIIEIAPLQFMRGRNFHNCFMLLDEGQNATYEQIKMFITRIGLNSRAVINGDTEQTDLPGHLQGGLSAIINRIDSVNGVGVCRLDNSDIVRNPIIGRILERLK